MGIVWTKHVQIILIMLHLLLTFVIRNNYFFILEGESPGIAHRLGSSGASHGGFGGRGACDNFLTCTLKRNYPYGNLYTPDSTGSGGVGRYGGSGT